MNKAQLDSIRNSAPWGYSNTSLLEASRGMMMCIAARDLLSLVDELEAACVRKDELLSAILAAANVYLGEVTSNVAIPREVGKR